MNKIANYTTEVAAEKSAFEIQTMLRNHGAAAVSIRYGSDKNPSGLAFLINTRLGAAPVPFELHANVAAVGIAINDDLAAAEPADVGVSRFDLESLFEGTAADEFSRGGHRAQPAGRLQGVLRHGRGGRRLVLRFGAGRSGR